MGGVGVEDCHRLGVGVGGGVGVGLVGAEK